METLKEFVEANPHLVSRKESENYPGLFVLKYKKCVFYDNLWNKSPWLLECRGTVVDKDYNFVIRPFTKIFNFGENNTYIGRNESCLAVEKINGFMAAATLYQGEIIVSTTGSLDSNFIKLAKKYLPSNYSLAEMMGVSSPDTLLFEICATEDPHIIKEEVGAYLIGHRFLDDECSYHPYKEQYSAEVLNDMMAVILECKRPKHSINRFDEVMKMTQESRREGVVVYGEKTALKIKSPYYLGTKFLARMRDDKLLTAWRNETITHRIDEEFYSFIENTDVEMFASLSEYDRITHIENYFKENRK